MGRLALGLSTKAQDSSSGGSEDGGSSSLWQALLNGHLLLPISLQGISIRLAPKPPQPRAVLPAAAASGNAMPGSAGVPGVARSSDSGGRKGRQFRAPLQLLGHLPLRVQDLTVVDEVSLLGWNCWEADRQKGICWQTGRARMICRPAAACPLACHAMPQEHGTHLRLRRIALSLHNAQQLLLEGLAAGLVLNGGGSSSNGGGGGSASAPASPPKAPCSPRKAPCSPFKRHAMAPPSLEVLPVLQLDRLLLEHQHDGSFSLEHLQLLRAASKPSSAPGSRDSVPATAAATAAVEPPQAAPLCLQRLSLQLGAVSLTVSKQLLVWAQAQQVAAAQAARQRPPRRKDSSSGRGVGSGKPLQVLRLLALLPKEAELAADSCTISTAVAGPTGSSSDGLGALAAEDEGLPLAAAFGLRGINCRLAKAAAAAGGDASGGGAALANIAAGWQHLAISLGAAPAAAEGQEREKLPSALAMSSGTAEWSLELSQAAGSSSHQQQPAAAQLAAVAQVSIGALHTDICHPAVQPLVVQLRQAAKAAKAALKPSAAAAAAAAADTAAASNAQAGEQLAPPPHQPQQPKASKGPPLLAQWQGSVSLGDGSRLLFTDAAGRCCWSNGLESCHLAVRSSGGSSDASMSAAAGVSGSFEVHGIEMHAVTTACGSLTGERTALPDGTPPQMLAAQLLRVQVEHGPPLEPLAAATELHASGQQQQATATSADVTTVGVHLLVQQQQLATVASVMLSLLPPPKAASLPGTPPNAATDSGSDAGTLVGVAAAAAAAAVAPAETRHLRPPRALPRVVFSCVDTLLLLPIQVAVPADQSTSSKLVLLPAAPALVLSSVSGSLVGGARLHAEGCYLLYCDGPASQRFPSSSDALKGAPCLLLHLAASCSGCVVCHFPVLPMSH